MSVSRQIASKPRLNIAVWLITGLVVLGNAQASPGVDGFASEALDAVASSGFVAIGPIESINLKERTITVLGQRFAVSSSSRIQVTQTARISPSLRALKSLQVGMYVAAAGELDGSVLILAELRSSSERYVFGSSRVFLRGVVTAVDASLGQLSVGNVRVDYTPMLAAGLLHQPELGSTVEILGTQPMPHGSLFATSVGWEAQGISGGDLNGISGGDLNGISGGDLNGISGGDLNGISGGDLNGISGGDLNGISGGDLNGISGGDRTQ